MPSPSILLWAERSEYTEISWSGYHLCWMIREEKIFSSSRVIKHPRWVHLSNKGAIVDLGLTTHIPLPPRTQPTHALPQFLFSSHTPYLDNLRSPAPIRERQSHVNSLSCQSGPHFSASEGCPEPFISKGKCYKLSVVVSCTDVRASNPAPYFNYHERRDKWAAKDWYWATDQVF